MKWLAIIALVIGVGIVGSRRHVVTVYKAVKPYEIRAAERYTRELAAYRADVKRDCVPVLRWDRRHLKVGGKTVYVQGGVR